MRSRSTMKPRPTRDPVFPVHQRPYRGRLLPVNGKRNRPDLDIRVATTVHADPRDLLHLPDEGERQLALMCPDLFNPDLPDIPDSRCQPRVPVRIGRSSLQPRRPSRLGKPRWRRGLAVALRQWCRKCRASAPNAARSSSKRAAHWRSWRFWNANSSRTLSAEPNLPLAGSRLR